MNELTVFNRNGQLYTDSRDVAKMIGKDHAHLMRDIDGYINALRESKIGFSEFFVSSTYKVKGNNKTYPCYLITKKGCEFVANKLTGEKGIIFTAAYVNAFHSMEDKLTGKLANPKRFSLASFNHLLEINIRQMKAAGEPATHIASWTNGMTRDVLSPFGIDVPALPDAVPTTYDATEMAKKLGVYSKNGIPHPQPITAIIKKIGLAPGETFTTETTAHGGRKDVPDVRYAGSVLDKVRKWLDTQGWPNPIILGKKYNVVYKERNKS
jgi:Rha family phage regulatory protein